MKKFSGSLPKNTGDELVGNVDCKFNAYGKEIIDVVGEFVHAIRVEDQIINLQPDTLYMYPASGSTTINVIRTINLDFNRETVPDVYPELLKHMTPPAGECCMFGDLNELIVRTSGSGLPAVKITVNNRITGYYLLSMNSWIVGDWTWHLHYITRVLPYVFPKLIEELNIKPCENSILTTTKKDKPRITCTVGADPELELTRNGVVIRADTNLGIENSLRSQIGCDGQSSILELRPKPGTPAQVVKNIRTLVKEFAKKWPSYDMTDTGSKYPLGGHIHVGVNQRVEPPRQLVTLFDDFIGRTTIDLSGTARGGYKAMGAYRDQPHGFEYRTTPASVFQNPMITFIVLKLAKNLAEKYFNGDLIEYNDVPTDEDYAKVGGLSESEISKFRKFCNSYEPTRSIRKSWKVTPVTQVPVTLFVPSVEFHDTWSSVVRENLLDAMLSGIQVEHEYRITFYGLAEDRCSSSSTLYLDSLRHYDAIRTKWSNARHLNIGISYDLRNYGMARSTITEIVQVIKSMLDDREMCLMDDDEDTNEDE